MTADAAPEPEARPYTAHSYHSAMGRSSVRADCPWCGADVLIYLWSLAGGGKRCSCGAKFTSYGQCYAPKPKKPKRVRALAPALSSPQSPDTARHTPNGGNGPTTASNRRETAKTAVGTGPAVPADMTSTLTQAERNRFQVQTRSGLTWGPYSSSQDLGTALESLRVASGTGYSARVFDRLTGGAYIVRKGVPVRVTKARMAVVFGGAK